MTPNLTELLERAEKALEGVTPRMIAKKVESGVRYLYDPDAEVMLGDVYRVADLDFITAARTLVPELAAALREAQAQIEDLKYQYSMDLTSGGGKHSSAWHVREILKKENAQLRTKLAAAEAELNGMRDYAGHHDRCPDKSYSVGVPSFCNCGWKKFRETWRSIREKEGAG